MALGQGQEKGSRCTRDVRGLQVQYQPSADNHGYSLSIHLQYPKFYHSEDLGAVSLCCLSPDSKVD